jgi:large subunit ribosomal protein L25
MSTRSTLQVSPRKRSGTGALKRLRREGLVPAIIYGKKFENSNLKVNARAIRDLLAHSTGENILVNLEIEGAGRQLALIQDVQHNPLNGGIIHVDFHAVKEDEKIHARITVELVGEPAGVKQGGLLEHLIHSLDVECLPKDLPDRISVDVSALTVGQSIHMREVTLPEGVHARLAGDVIVALVAEPRVVEEPVAAAPVAVETKTAAKPDAKAEAAKPEAKTDTKAPAKPEAKK